jgi:choline dehydrogenase-like flavoprotein
MATLLGPQNTAFTLDTMGRFLCNTLPEATDSVNEALHCRTHPFDVIIIGGGTFGSVLAERLFALDPTNSRRILVLEGGPFIVPEHVQNTAFGDPTPAMRVPWEAHPGLKFAGLLYAVGGRSLKWGGWSPELLHEGAKGDEMAGWPGTVAAELKNTYFHQSGGQIGVNTTNDFIFGPLHRALRARLFAGLTGAGAPTSVMALNDVPESPLVRAFRVQNGVDPTDSELRTMLDLPSTDTTPRAQLLNALKLEAPLAVEAHAETGDFPGNKFSAVPLLTKASRLAANEADGAGPEADARKRLMIVGSCHVQELITETQGDNWVRVTGVRVLGPGDVTVEYMLRPPQPDGRQGVVVLAAGTVESTRIALTTFQQSLAGRAAQRMGQNLMCHLRSNFGMRIPIAAYPGLPKALAASALFVKGKAHINGKDRFFHLQITASAGSTALSDSEAELFKKVPDLDSMEKLRLADDKNIALVLRGIGEMSSHNLDSGITLTGLPPQDFFRPRAQVSIGNAHVNDPNASQQTRDDNALWGAMDDFTEQVALIFANGHPFELLTKAQVIPMAATATATDIRNAYPREGDRRDGLGTTHHEAGPLWMGDDVATSVTNEHGRVHDTTNCYVAGPALFPTIGSPNPMLTGVALARRTGEKLTSSVLSLAKITPEAGFRSLFDGSRASLSQWRMFGQGKFDLRDGVIVARPFGGLGLLAFPEGFNEFELRLQFFLDRVDDNSGVFVRFRNPLKPVPRRDGSGSDIYNDLTFVAVDTGFEIQIDELASPDGLDKHRTGAIYNIPTTPGWIQQDFRGRNRQAKLNDWNDYSIQVNKSTAGDVYTVRLNGELTTSYTNTDAYRGKPVALDANSGWIGLQSHTGRVGFRNIRIKS